MEKESNNYLDGTIILLALFAQRYIFGQRYTPLFEKGTKQNQKSPMDTTDGITLPVKYILSYIF